MDDVGRASRASRASSSDQGTISLVIKTPNQAHGDRLIHGVALDWTVGDLKTRLAEVHPSSPTEKEQRLIHSGKLLPDHLRIGDVFRKTDPVPVLHLVLNVRTQSAPQGNRPKVKVAEAQSSAPMLCTPPPDPAPGPTPPAGLRQRGHPGNTAAALLRHQSAVAGVTPAVFPLYSLYSPQQLLWLQHMYAQQYYMQYHAALAAGSSSPLPVSTQQPSTTALPNQGPINNLPANQNPDPAFINPEGANPNLRMNAQGGAMLEDEEEVERDWLDWVYVASRVGVFLSIVYFYSSLSKFLLVSSCLLLMYLYTTGWFPFRQRAHARPIAAAADLQNQQNQQNQEHENQILPAGQVAPPRGVEAGLLAVPVAPVRVSVVWTAWLFFRAFFASLIPDVPQGVAN